TNITAVLSTSDPFITLNNNTATYDDIAGGGSGTNVNAFNMDIAPNCPDGHIVSFQLNIQSDQDEWQLFCNIQTYAPSIIFDYFLINDGNNNIIDPGETSDMLINFFNQGGAAAYNAYILLFSADPYLIINDAEFNFGTFSQQTSETGFFNISVDESAPVGHSITINWLINADFTYQAEDSFEIVVSQVPVLVEEYFTTFPPPGWTIQGNQNWVQGNGNHAGGNAPEAQFNWSPSSVGDFRLITMPINTTGSSELSLQFKHMIDHFSGDYTLYVQTSSDGSGWNNVISFPPEDMPATDEDLTVETPDIGSATLRIAFTYSGDSYNIDHWYIDNVIIESISAEPVGYISGIVSLNGGNGELEDVIIQAGEQVTSPNNEGEYIIALPAGLYTLTATLPGYSTAVFEGVQVFVMQTTQQDLTLDYLSPPQNLTAQVQENNVLLSWDNPVCSSYDKTAGSSREKTSLKINQTTSRTSSDTRSSRELTAYRLYRNDELIFENHPPLVNNYYDENLPNGFYLYYVTAVYENDESSPSNTVEVEVDFTSNENGDLPAITILGNNYPNPFNPETMISFQMAYPGRIRIDVFNLRGQLIRNLLDEIRLAGKYQITWNGRDEQDRHVPSGIYLYRMVTNHYQATRKMLLLQ
ncbi:MAG: T9SS type A sorting domain-containing protein, partial [Candidatus Cloacimonetes bacterium]|nr:T9SS type A sorting domain-containing protein [Candidatus Cloacimonadota bacterium]